MNRQNETDHNKPLLLLSINYKLVSHIFEYFITSIAISFRITAMLCFHGFYFLLVNLFDLGYTRTKLFSYPGIVTVSR